MILNDNNIDIIIVGSKINYTSCDLWNDLI